jgi:GNAT superfamily N-acetyltransferase
MGVRRMRAEDRPQIEAWKRIIWHSYDGVDDDGEMVWVSEAADGLGGFVAVTLRPRAAGCATAPVPYVEGWFVRADLRRSGVGRALVDAVEEWARSAGFSEMGSDVEADNSVSLQAHRRLGFQPTKAVQFFRKSLDGDIEDVRVELHTGSRAPLRPLFELAEDSATQLDAYIDAGRVLVALSGTEVVGHLHLVDAEIKNMAVRQDQQGQGIGGRLVRAAIVLAGQEKEPALWVATATADIDNLRFYQRQGFRMRSIERDVFTTATGYPPGLRADGIEVRDRVWLDRPIAEQPSSH